MPVEIYIGNLELNYDLEISETNPKAFLSKIYKYLYGYEPSKSIKEILEVLSKNRRKIKILIRNIFRMNSKSIEVLEQLLKNPNFTVIISLDTSNLFRIKSHRYRNLIKKAKLFLNDQKLDGDTLLRSYNVLPIILSSIITFYIYRLFLVARYFKMLDIAIALVFTYLIIIRLVTYNIK